MNPLVTLTTDFGTQDGYVGAMKGVILGELPGACVVDIAHDVPPQDVLAGAFALEQAAPYFPPGTVHVAVVDPGVGSRRRALVVEAAGSVFVGPDNGLLSLAALGPASRVHGIDRVPDSWRIHPTFHGRDLFARVAARLAAGAKIADFSTGKVDPVRVDLGAVERAGGDLVGLVIHVDRFGNLVTNLPGDRVEGPSVEIGGAQAVRAVTYADVESGRLVAYTGSAGYLAVAVRDGAAAALLDAGRGARGRARASSG
jgi:S-adenosylmethionine hydrolase